MKFNVNFSVTEKYLPTKRHKNLRTRIVERNTDIDVKEVTAEQFPIAFIVHDYKSVYEGATNYNDFEGKNEYKTFIEEIRTDGNKLYMPIRVTYGAAVSTVFESLDYIKKDIKDYPEYFFGKDEFTEKSIIVEDNSNEKIGRLNDRAKNYIIYDGKIYKECGEPMYNITTFGLGHNHGGTGFFIEYSYNPNISKENYFSALERDKAIAYGKSVATRRGDTESVDRMGTFDNIEVLMPEMVKRNPQKEHGNGCGFLNSLESMIEGTENSTEARFLVMAMTMASIG